MRKKLNITTTIILILALAVTAIISIAFTYRVLELNSSFTSYSTYEVREIAKATIIDKKVNIEAKEGIDASKILSSISNKLEEKIDGIHKEYTTEIKGNSQTSKASTTTTVVEAPANLNNLEAAILHLINTIRVSNGLSALSSNQMLTDIARGRSSDMISMNYFSHYTPDGKNIFNILKDYGVRYINAGENLAHSSPVSIGTPEALMNAWMASPTHKANILRAQYGKIGIGIVDSGGRRVLTTVFMN